MQQHHHWAIAYGIATKSLILQWTSITTDKFTHTACRPKQMVCNSLGRLLVMAPLLLCLCTFDNKFQLFYLF